MALKERVAKEAILEAAEKIFSQHGFHRAKIYRIADLAGVSVGTIYRFFKSKDELYAEVVRKKLSELQRRVEKNIKNKSPEKALKAYISTVIDFFEEERDFFTIFMREIGSLSIIDEERLNLARWYEKYVQGLSKIVERGVKRGVFKEVDPLSTVIAISGALKNTVYARSRGLINLPPQKVKEHLYEIFVRGIMKE